MTGLFMPAPFPKLGSFEWLGEVVGDTTSLYDMAGMNFGTPSSTRLIVGAIHWEFGSSNRALSTCTIGGVSATIIIQDSHTGGITGLGAAIVSAVVPTGDSGTVSSTYSGGITGTAVSLFRANNLVSNTPFDTLEVRGDADTDINGLIDVPERGICLLVGSSSTNGSTANVTLTGADEIYDVNLNTSFGFAGRACSGLTTRLPAETSRFCRYQFAASNSGAEMMVCTWQMA